MVPVVKKNIINLYVTTSKNVYSRIAWYKTSETPFPKQTSLTAW